MLLQELVNRQLVAAESAESESTGPRLELSALKPLWQLYTILVKDYGEWLVAYMHEVLQCMYGLVRGLWMNFIGI